MTQSQFIQRLKQQPRMGISIDDLTNLLGTLGDTIRQTLEEIPSLGKAIELQSGAFTKSKTALLDLNNANAKYLTGLERAIAFNQRSAESFMAINKEALFFEKRNASLQKGLNLTRQQTAKLAQEFAKAGEALSVSSELVNSYGGNIKKLIPSMDLASNVNSTFYQGLLAVQDVITTNMGLSAEQAENYSLFAGQGGDNAAIALKTTAKLSAQLDAQYGIQGAQQDIVEGISEATATTALQYGRIPGTLELAVLKSKQLGLSLNDLASTGKNLLDIESSIGQELEYQLLSGHRLTIEGGKSLTNEYRMATLKGDANRQADIMNKLLTEEGETLENNMLARQQMASMLGMSEDSLSKSLQKQKLINQLGEQGKILFALEGEKDFLTTAQAMADSGEITQEELKAVTKLGDKRKTEDILEEQLGVLEDIRLNDFLQTKQGSELSSLFDTLGEDFKAYNNDLFDITADMDKAQIRELGGILQKATAIGDVKNMKDFLIDAKAEVTGKPKEDFMIRSSGEVLSFTSQDDVIGAKKDGPIDKMLNSSGGGGGSSVLHIDYDKLASAMTKVKLEVAADPVAYRVSK